jgi:FMN-dependent NADH-azoreductase
MKLLHVDSSITGERSVSRRLTSRIVESLRHDEPSLEVTYRDLASHPLAHHAIAPASEPDGAAAVAALEEFLEADVVVIGAPMYNFTIPSQLKAWVDALLIAGKTFAYGEGGPKGLAGPKRVIVASSRGNVYSSGAYASLDHHETYLANVFGFIGIPDVEIVRAEGVNLGDEARQTAIERALAHADAITLERRAAA